MVNVCFFAYNRPRLTEQALKSMGPVDNLTIVDDGSDEPTRTLLDSWREFHPVALVRNEDGPLGTGSARNIGIEASAAHFGKGDYLYIGDNDVCYLRPDWLKILVECYEDVWTRGFMVIGAGNHPFHLQENPQFIQNLPDFRVNEVIALSSQSMLLRWEIWDRFGPFVKTAPREGCQSEDIEITNRMRAAGGRLGVVSPALLANCGLTNSAGKQIPGADLVRAQCPPGVYCE